MCSIIVLKPKQMIDKESLMNACFNNWHSFGLVTKVDGKLDITREAPKSGEIDGEKIYALLQDDFEYERILHVRHNTAGATNLENTHPFDVYYDEKTGEQIVFMHNGTMYDFKSKKMSATGSMIDDDDGPSDSKNFTDEILIPYITADFGTGPGDIKNPQFQKLIRKFWPGTGSNRGILISAKNPSFMLGEWKTVGAEGNKILASNDDYFDKVIRGPELERRRHREEEDRKRMAEVLAKKAGPVAITTSSAAKGAVQPLKNFRVEEGADIFKLSDSMRNIFTDWDVWDRDGMVSLGYATKEELEALYASKDDCLIAMDLVFTEFAKVMKEKSDLMLKNARASKHIETMARKLKAIEEAKTTKKDKKAA